MPCTLYAILQGPLDCPGDEEQIDFRQRKKESDR